MALRERRVVVVLDGVRELSRIDSQRGRVAQHASHRRARTAAHRALAAKAKGSSRRRLSRDADG